MSLLVKKRPGMRREAVTRCNCFFYEKTLQVQILTILYGSFKLKNTISARITSTTAYFTISFIFYNLIFVFQKYPEGNFN
jgi:hypothetical protein